MIINNSPKRRMAPLASPSLCNPNLNNGNYCHEVSNTANGAQQASMPSTTPGTTINSPTNCRSSPITSQSLTTNSNPATQPMEPYSNMLINGSNTNLTEDSSLLISQSMESINTLGTCLNNEGVRTLFVSGLPLDTKTRELYLLFRGYKGYLSSTLKPAGKNGKLTAPVGFVTFETREQAEVAMSDLKGVKFDPDGIQHMRLEFARSNTKVTKPKAPMMPMNLSPLSIAGLMANGIGGMQAVSSPSQYQNQHHTLMTQQQAMNLANFNAVVNGNPNGIISNFSPALFSQLPAFDPALLAQAQDSANSVSQANWDAYLNPFELLNQAGLLSNAPLNSQGHNNQRVNANLSQQHQGQNHQIQPQQAALNQATAYFHANNLN